jgi:hypothetical protein
MKNILLLTVVLIAGRAEAGTALDCLEASERSANLEACLNEADRNDDVPGIAAKDAPMRAPALSAPAVGKPAPRQVPTPAGWTEGEDGTLKTGFYKGLDSGFKAAFAAIESPAVYGMQAAGTPYKDNLATTLFMGLGVVLSIPAAVIGAVLGAPIGAAAGMIAEKVSPGSTKTWFTF